MPVRLFIDQLKDKIFVPFPPRRIISLVPSQTELLYDLGLDAEVVGITRFCIRPEQWSTRKTIIGGTKKFDLNTIDALAPDLIIGNKEENYETGITALKAKYPVWMSDIITLQDALSMITAIGELTDRRENAKHVVETVTRAFETIQSHPPLSALYLIWKKPWMVAASTTFIDSMLRTLGLENAVSHLDRYPELTAADITSLKPDIIFLSNEPYPFSHVHIDEIRQLSPSSKVVLVDGEMFSWYGTRMLKAPAYFNSLNLV